MIRNSLSCVAALVSLSLASAAAQDDVVLAERFDPTDAYRVELKVRLSGRLAIPGESGKIPTVVPMSGSSLLTYDERPLPPGDPKTLSALRVYRDVQFARTVGGRDQSAEVRPAVRRMVVLRSDRGKKAPFSPDGPLTWGEIDVVRTDLFAPALVPDLLPNKAVRPRDRWPVGAAAVAELTDFDTVDSGGLTAEFVSVVSLDGKRFAKLVVSGTATGATDDGPSRQKLDGTAYFDLGARRLAYLNLNGTHELLGPDGKVTGRVDGTFVMTRGPAGRTDDLSESAARTLDLRPTESNTLLLYDNPDLGVRFLHPRRWRVGAVQGNQVTVEESGGGGILITAESPRTLPAADQYQRETREYLRKQNWAVGAAEAPRRAADRPARVDRFALDAEVNREKVRMEYAVVAQPEGGATVAARLPWADRAALERDVDTLLRSLVITKRIER